MISNRDCDILRDIAKKQVDIALSPKMAEVKKAWETHGAFGSSGRPMILINTSSFEDEVIPPLMRCQGKEAREIEWGLHRNVINHTLFRDDTVVEDKIPISSYWFFTLFGLEVRFKRSESLAYRFISYIRDLEEDFHLIGKSKFGDKRDVQHDIDIRNDIFGDILPAAEGPFVPSAYATLELLHLIEMEDMYTAMLDYPDLFHKMMELLTVDFLEYFDMLERENALLPTTGSCSLQQGTYCYNNEIPDHGNNLTTRDTWGYMDSQETTGISPATFNEFIAPYYRRIIDRFGLLSYGCCEAVHTIWDSFLSKLDNLRKVSISPWCDEEFMGEQLRGKNIVYLRKVSPNYLGFGKNLDEDALRTHIAKTISASKGCYLELIQNDVHKINGTWEKVARFTEILRECSGNHIR